MKAFMEENPIMSDYDAKLKYYTVSKNVISCTHHKVDLVQSIFYVIVTPSGILKLRMRSVFGAPSESKLTEYIYINITCFRFTILR